MRKQGASRFPATAWIVGTAASSAAAAGSTHPADVERLLALLDRLVDASKSVIIIEHRHAVMVHADWIINVGPDAGHDGGPIMFEGTPADLIAARSILTGMRFGAYVGT